MHENLQPEIVRLYWEGLSLPAIGRQLGIHAVTVRKYAQQTGLDTTLKSSQRILERARQQVTEAYQSGQTLDELGKEYQVGYKAVRIALQRWNVEIRNWFGAPRSDEWRQRVADARRQHSIDPDEVVRLYDGTRTCQEVGELLGVSDEWVREQLARLGVERLPAKARTTKNHFWAGGLTVDRHGYILVKSPDHPAATKAGYVRQHRLVMEQSLDRFLDHEEVVDHRNRDTSDNRIENLVLYANNTEHLKATLTGTKNLTKEQREVQRQEAVRRARQRVAAILVESGNDAHSSP